MKRIKLFILIGMVLLCCSCTVDYNIEFKTDHTISEKVVIKEDTNVLNKYEYSVSEIVESKLYSYQSEINRNNFSVKKELNSDITKVTLISQNKNINNFTRMSYFGKMFNGADIKETKNTYSFKTNGTYRQSGLFYDELGIADEGFVDKLNINITFENEVINSNADQVDEKTNTYTWILDRDTKDKSIEFELSNKIVKKIKKEKKNNNSIYILYISAVLLAIVVLFIYLLFINKKNNEI